MSSIHAGVMGAKVKLVSDDTYHTTVKSLVENARYQCFCTLFIVDIDPVVDEDLLVDTVLFDLKAAQWRGCDTRLLIGGSRTNAAIAEFCLASKHRAEDLGIPCRLMASQDVRGTHVKMVVADQYVLTGSHNWSAGAFSGQIQDSVLVESSALAAYMQMQFRRQWRRANIRVTT